MAAIDLSATMDAIADVIRTSNVTPRSYAWPIGNITVPCAVVAYPTNLDFDMTFKRGGDRATFPIYFMVGKAGDKSSRDALSAIITGATSVKNNLDGDLDGAVQSSRVTNCHVEEVSVAGVDYLAAVFTLEVFT